MQSQRIVVPGESLDYTYTYPESTQASFGAQGPQGPQGATGDQPSGAVLLDGGSPNSILTIWSGTQAQYDAIGSKSATTLYFIE